MWWVCPTAVFAVFVCMQTVILLHNEIAPLPKLYDEIAPPYVTHVDTVHVSVYNSTSTYTCMPSKLVIQKNIAGTHTICTCTHHLFLILNFQWVLREAGW